jgi:putative transposase
VTHVQQVLGISERRACKALGQARSSQRLVSRKTERDRELLERMRQLAAENPEYGYRMIWATLRQEGMEVNVKRVHRVWKQEGLKVVRPRPKRERAGTSENACSVSRAEYPNHVWTYDFMFDETSDGRKLKFLNVVDEYTRLCLRIEVGRSMTARTVVRVLAELVQIHGEPGALRSDNGSEFTAEAVKEWLASAGIATRYVEPGSPWENGYAESFNSRFRADFLDREISDRSGRHEARVWPPCTSSASTDGLRYSPHPTRAGVTHGGCGVCSIPPDDAVGETFEAQKTA